MFTVKNVQYPIKSGVEVRINDESINGIPYDAYLKPYMGGASTTYPLRWAVVKAQKDQENNLFLNLSIEATLIERSDNVLWEQVPRSRLSLKALGEKKLPPQETPVFLHIVPAGFKAKFGGALGDAMPVNRVLSHMGLLVTHPNTCNGGPLNLMDVERTLYVADGSIIDAWARQEGHLEQKKANKIGIIIDSGINDVWAKKNLEKQIMGFVAHSGVSIQKIVWTKKSLGGKAVLNPSGAFVGEVEDIDTLIEAGDEIVSSGAEAVAIFSHVHVPEMYLEKYCNGELPNPYGGYEAIMSHTFILFFNIPAAHAPVLSKSEVDYLQEKDEVIPEAGLEAAAPFYTWSVLWGLHKAPRLVSSQAPFEKDFMLPFTNVSALICPASSIGGIPMFRAHHLNVPIIAVKENTTVLKVTASTMGMGRVVEVENYLQAFGLLQIVMKHRAGDFSPTTVKEVWRTTDHLLLRNIGMGIAEDAGVDPRALMRPLSI